MQFGKIFKFERALADYIGAPIQNVQGRLFTGTQRLLRIIQKRFNLLNSTNIWRCIVFMEDWKSGHYFEIDGRYFMPWKASDYVVWNDDVPHMAANIGLEPRYTLQITGIRE